MFIVYQCGGQCFVGYNIAAAAIENLDHYAQRHITTCSEENVRRKSHLGR